MRRLLVTLFLAAVCCLAAGCGYLGIDAVKTGMMPSDVEAAMGAPDQVIHGDGADLGNKTYVYAAGKVHFVNQSVVLVEKAEDQATITDRVRQQREKDQPRPDRAPDGTQPQSP